ncbi:TRM11, partial [Symbiodinium pilosum]
FTFRDVMAGPGWAKEWNWGHHVPHMTHETGPMIPEIDEMMDEMQRYDKDDTSIDV